MTTGWQEIAVAMPEEGVGLTRPRYVLDLGLFVLLVERTRHQPPSPLLWRLEARVTTERRHRERELFRRNYPTLEAAQRAGLGWAEKQLADASVRLRQAQGATA